MELSTNIPIPSASPLSDIMFRDTSEEYIRKNVATTERGIDREMIRVLFRLRRKIKRIITASIPPIIAVFSTSSTESLIKLDWSKTTSNFRGSLCPS